MRTVVEIGGYADLTGRNYVFEKEVMLEEGKSIQEAVLRLVDQLNNENTLILYYVLCDEENTKVLNENNERKGSRSQRDKGDSL